MSDEKLNLKILKKMGFKSDHEYLGKGTFGAVFRVEDDDGNFYALKMQLAEDFNDRKWETPQKVRDSRCPYLIEHFDLEHHLENVYLQLEFANAGSLADLLNERKLGMNIFSLRCMWQILTGVSILHAHMIIHRDLKAENILCNKNARGEITMKISDFGLARVVSSQVQAKTECGTPLHMSPEIFAGLEYGAPADAWSVGVLFYRIATNGESHPFPAKTIPELLEMINKPIIRDTKYFPSPKADLYWDILEKMICIKINARATIADILRHPLFAPYKSENDFPPSSKFVDPPPPPVAPSASPKSLNPPTSGRSTSFSSSSSSTTSPASDLGFSLLSVSNTPTANPFARVVSVALPGAKRMNKAGKAPPLPPPPVV